jgi:hypothetical protein
MTTASLPYQSSLVIRTFTKFFLVIVITFQSPIAQAKKMNYPFEVIIGMADLIVSGEIASISGDTSYVFIIDQTVKGKSDLKIKVKMFQNWACDVRLKKAEVGQKLFLCLTRQAKNYEIIGGSDGEIFIIDGKLLLFNIYNRYISHYFPKADSPKLNDVIIAIKNLMSCYSFVKTIGPGTTFKQIKEDAEILSFKNVNKFSVWLFDSVSRDIMNYNAIKF